MKTRGWLLFAAVIALGSAVGIAVCYGSLSLWDHLEDAGVIPPGL